MGGKIWNRRVGICFIQFCNTRFDFLPKVGIGSPTCSSFGSKVPNTFLRRCQSHNSLFSLQPSTTSGYDGCSRWIWKNLFWSHLLLQRAAYLCHWWCCLAYRPRCQNRGFIIPNTNSRCRFKIFIAKSISWKRPKARIFKASQNILHDKWNWMCRVHHPVILCNSVFCRKRSHDSNIKRL